MIEMYLQSEGPKDLVARLDAMIDSLGFLPREGFHIQGQDWKYDDDGHAVPKVMYYVDDLIVLGVKNLSVRCVA